jgi:Na+/H+ antiporter NhaC
MKRALMIALIVAVLFTGFPVFMAMSATTCADCDFAMMAAGGCVLAVLAALAVLASAPLATPLRSSLALRASLLASSGLERPPRLA